MPVLGVGTVSLPTEKAPGHSGPDAHGQLVLHDVLYIPSAVCNIIGLTKEDDQKLRITTSWDETARGTIKDTQGQTLAYFDLDPSKPLFQVKLSGPPVGPVVGPSIFDEPRNTAYCLNVCWEQSELVRWEAYKRNQSRTIHTAGLAIALPPTNNTPQNTQTSPGYNAAEKAWLKTHFGNEFKFLRMYALSIYKEEDREEGREIVRAFMENDSQDEGDEDEESEESDEDDESDEDGESDEEDEDEESDEDTEGYAVD
ncbi:hypothetical protein BU16DRAFT_523161 [Lophium mytilinum]|uniref:Uncharacterized protein n=1 Tax=Lophium mytilinum TaxID=390894 RepID=A0A6A6R7L1_9PEZI|nr:hypothetical protein BU16DRAFT_523161 [Lophium mytilinum]